MCFQKRRCEQWKYILLKGKRATCWLLLSGKNKRQSMAIESCRRFTEEEHWEKNFVGGQDFLRLDWTELGKWIFSRVGWCSPVGWLGLVSLSPKRTKFSWNTPFAITLWVPVPTYKCLCLLLKFIFHLSSRNNCFHRDPLFYQTGYFKTFWDFWQTFQYQILTRVFLTSS